jgi:hypothetical protein
MNTMESLCLKLILIFSGLAFVLYTSAQRDSSLQIDTGNISELQEIVSKPKIWDYIVDSLTPIIALITVLIARPLLKKKLIENHVTKRIEEIHKSNSLIRLYCQKLISRYTPLTYDHNKLSNKDIKNLSNDLEEGFLITGDSSSEVATLMYNLKSTILQFERKFSYYDKYFSVFTSDLLPFVVNSLQKIVTYSTQVVPVPITTEIRSVDLIVESLGQFVTDGKISKFKNFKLGVNYDENSASRLIYIDMINHTNKPYLMECASLTTDATRSIAKLLYVRKIYAPLNWASKKNPNSGFLRRKLVLVGFIENKNVNMDTEKSTETVALYYSNLSSVSHKPKLTDSTFVNDFMDDWLKVNNYALPKPLKFNYETDEMIKAEFDRESLQKAFNSYKGKITKRLKIKSSRQ